MKHQSIFKKRTAGALILAGVLFLLPALGQTQPPEEAQTIGKVYQALENLTHRSHYPPDRSGGKHVEVHRLSDGSLGSIEDVSGDTSESRHGIPEELYTESPFDRSDKRDDTPHYPPDRAGGKHVEVHRLSDGSLGSIEDVSGDTSENRHGIPEELFNPPVEPKSYVAELRKKYAARRARRALARARSEARQQKQAALEQAAEQAQKRQSQGCFPEDMHVVMADGSTRSIAAIRVGDMVLTYDIGYDKFSPQPVLQVYSVHSNHLYTINNALKSTSGERVLADTGWKHLGALTEDDQLHVNGQLAPVETIAYQRKDLKTFNLVVGDTHNFLVRTPSGDAFIVHNGGGGGRK